MKLIYRKILVTGCFLLSVATMFFLPWYEIEGVVKKTGMVILTASPIIFILSCLGSGIGIWGRKIFCRHTSYIGVMGFTAFITLQAAQFGRWGGFGGSVRYGFYIGFFLAVVSLLLFMWLFCYSVDGNKVDQ